MTVLGAASALPLAGPRGDWETHRPSWHGDRIEFAGREGFVRLALAADLRRRLGADPDVSMIYESITTMMQQTLDQLAADRRWPVIG